MKDIASLVMANVLALGIAIAAGWSASALMLVYWAQSVIIGLAYVVRMLSLQRFSTDGLTMNGRPVPATPAARLRVVVFFALHYGFFHAVYLAFLLGDGGAVFDRWLAVAVVAFVLNHVYSYRYNRILDRRGKPNLGTLMFTPYLRIVPMHLTVILGGVLGAGTTTLLLFGMLKTLADVAMHVVEHRQLRRTPAPEPP